MPNHRLIFNADDYGRTARVSQGIRDAHQHGVVTSTTCMLNFPTTAADIQTAQKETPALGLGVHLVLTAGGPMCAPETVPSLVDAAGSFHSLAKFRERRADLKAEEVKAEWRAQIEAFCAVAGRLPTHLDSHHHTSYAHPRLFRTMLELAREYQCAVRLPVAAILNDRAVKVEPDLAALLREFAPRAPDGLYAGFYAEQATLTHLLEVLARPQAGVYEIMCHPGYSDAELAAGSSYAVERERELAVLTDPALRAAINEQGWELASFAALAQ